MVTKSSPKLLLNPGIVLPFLGIALVSSVVFHENRVQAQAYAGNSQQVQDEQIRYLQRQVDINTGRLNTLEVRGSDTTQQNARDLKLLELRVTNLEQSFWLWRGIVYGFGSLITLVEILQALGLIRYKARLHDVEHNY